MGADVCPAGHVDKSLYTSVQVEPSETFVSFVNSAGGGVLLGPASAAGWLELVAGRLQNLTGNARRLADCLHLPPLAAQGECL